MSPCPRFFSWILVLLSALSIFGPSQATTIDPIPFEELVIGADLVGVVECVQAGGIVAHYQVVEAWKGAKVGDRVAIRIAVNFWEPQYPLTLCGDRYFVTAYKEAPSRIMSTTSGGPVPLWWREIPADFSLPLFQGRIPLGNGNNPDADRGALEKAEFEKTRAKVAALLAGDPRAQELALLKGGIEQDLFNRRRREKTDDQNEKALQTRLLQIESPEALLDELLRIAKEDPEGLGAGVRRVLYKGGRAITLDRLEKLKPKQAPWDKLERDGLIDGIRDRLKPREPRENTATREIPVPSADEIAKMRKDLVDGGESYGEALETLTQHDPASVAAYLMNWVNPNVSWRDADRGYVLGSYFGWKCGKDRTTHFTQLLKAKDPNIRVAAAVYLCFDEVAAGTAALKELSALEGLPGAWAALTLARRGHKDAVEWAIAVFRPSDDEVKGGMASVPRRNVQKRVLELLSNSARAGGAPQPPRIEDQADARLLLLRWWKENSAKVELRDPWLSILEKQKVD